MHYIGMNALHMCYKCRLKYFMVSTALIDDNGNYFVNGDNVLRPYAENFSYGGVTLTYTGIDAVFEQVQSGYTRKLTRDLYVQVSPNINFVYILSTYRMLYAQCCIKDYVPRRSISVRRDDHLPIHSTADHKVNQVAIVLCVQ